MDNNEFDNLVEKIKKELDAQNITKKEQEEILSDTTGSLTQLTLEKCGDNKKRYCFTANSKNLKNGYVCVYSPVVKITAVGEEKYEKKTSGGYY